MVRLPILIAALLVAATMASVATNAQSGSSSGNPPPGPNDPDYKACMEHAQNEDQKRGCANDYCTDHQDQFCQSWCHDHPGASSCPQSGSTGPKPQDTGNHSGTGNKTTSPNSSQSPGEPGNDPAFKECYRSATTPEQRQGCMEHFCANHPNSQGCQRWCKEHPGAPGCANPDCKSKENQAKPCQAIATEERRWIHFEMQKDAPGIANYYVQDLLALAKVQLNEQPIGVHRDGTVIEARGEHYVLRLHDEPGGLVRYEGTMQIIVGFPTDATITHNEKEALITYASGERGVLRYENATWWDSSNKVTLTGFFAFHVPPREVPGVVKAELRNGLRQAMQNGHLGAQVVVNRTVAGQNGTQVLAYDDVDVRISGTDNLATTARPLSIELSANLTSGRTIALSIDPHLLPSPDAKRLVLHYFDLNDGNRTEIVFRQASSLQDILDPTDDAGQPEYWIVQDTNGIQVMITVPHWSSHLVTLGGLDAILQPNVLAGIAAGIAGSVLAGAALFWPRRPNE